MIKGFNQIKETMDKTASLFKMKSGENKLVRVLVPTSEVSAAWEHVEQIGGFWKTIECLGKRDCPICKAGKTASFRTYLPILDIAEDKVKIFKASKDVVKALIAFEEEYDDLTAIDLKVVRLGEGLKTTYQFFKKDPSKIDISKYADMIPNPESLIEQLTKEEIAELLDGESSVSPPNDPADEEMPF
jgi:hypothetical protein